MKLHFIIFDLFRRFLLAKFVLIRYVSLSLTCFLLSSVWTGATYAKEIHVIPSVDIRTEYDDNIRLRGDSPSGIDLSALGVITHAQARFGAKSNRYDLALDTQVSIKRYESDFDLDSEDFSVNFKSNYTVTERNTFGLRGSYVQNTTLTSEFDENGTGLVQDNITREQWSISPDWTYTLSSTQFLQANFSHSEVIYEETTSGSFFDFSTDNISVSYSQQLTELFSSYVSVTAMFFEVPEVFRETTEYTVNLGVEYQFFPTWSTSLSVGRRFTNTESTFVLNNVQVTISDDAEGMIFAFGLKKQFESGSVAINYYRSTSPQGNGQLREQDRFSVNVRHKITKHLQFSLDGGVSIDSNSGSQNQNNDRTYFNIRPMIRWQFNANMNVSAGYQYRRQEFESNNNVAESNSIFANFNYQWDKLSTQKY